MNNSSRIAVCSLLASVAAVGLAAAAAPDDAKKHSMGSMDHGNPSMKMHMAMTSHQGMKMPMSGNVDKDFAAMMIMHHQQAIKMADVEIAHGKDEELKALAAKMRQQQLGEIEKLKKHK
jgi:uncharacterized protein (DUF305 family)